MTQWTTEFPKAEKIIINLQKCFIRFGKNIHIFQPYILMDYKNATLG